MAPAALKRPAMGLWPMVALFVLLLVSLSFMSDATHNSERFGRLYSWLLLVNALGLVVLVALIGTNLYWMVCQYRTRAAGARLTGRLVATFVVLAVLPVLVVYYFSVQFLERGIDSWFDVRIETALDDALELSRSSLNARLRGLLDVTERMAEDLAEVPAALASLNLYDLRVRSGAVELTLLGLNGRIIGASSVEPTDIVPNRPAEGILQQVRHGQHYVGLDPIGDTGLHVRAVVMVEPTSPEEEPRILQALYSVPERLSVLAENVQDAYVRYKELAYLRKPLKYSYTLTLSLVLVLSLLSAVWGAFHAARRLVAPIRDLAEGTRAVSDGDYSKRLPVTGNDELSFLVQSFNYMTRQIARARDQARRSQHKVEDQRAYLETLLGSLSTGVISVSADGVLRTANDAADRILGVTLTSQVGESLSEISRRFPFLVPMLDNVRAGGDGRLQWQQEITLFGTGGRQVLMCRSAVLPGDGAAKGGRVLVFDDVTALIQAQRDAAWGEVARRLAHEIKNPLTPIQLSAERLRRKYLDMMPPAEAEFLDRATHTIVQQVEAMKEMVNAFSEYARQPVMQREMIDLDDLVREVAELYPAHPGEAAVGVETGSAGWCVDADKGRLRQLLHNLIKNAREATGDTDGARVRLATVVVEAADERWVELSVEDNGPGFPEDVLEQVFDPYVTTKPKGTGLGLAIVKRIVEEHGGQIVAENRAEGGACMRIRLHAVACDEPVEAPAGTGMRAARDESL